MVVAIVISCSTWFDMRYKIVFEEIVVGLEIRGESSHVCSRHFEMLVGKCLSFVISCGKVF